MTYDGKLLTEEDTKLRDLGIREFSTLQASISVLGGGKKRKKKVYTTQKRIPRKRVKIKLRVLQLYKVLIKKLNIYYKVKKVDDDGKVQRLKKQCPNCRPGTFMATHYDRTSCGRCTLTYKYTNE